MEHRYDDYERDQTNRDQSGGKLSIGALSRATGIPIDTLRTWERRYGFPTPARRESGHRVYSVSDVERLRRIATALEMGVRAREAVSASDADLESLVQALPAPARNQSAPRPTAGPSTQAEVDVALQRAVRLDSAGLQADFQALWVRLGPTAFCSLYATPLAERAGECQTQGEIGLAQNRFLVDQILGFLRVARVPFEDRAQGPRILFATLPESEHRIGMEMAAMVASFAGCRATVIGTSIPADELAAVARQVGAHGIAISVPGLSGSASTRTELMRLRESMPKRAALLLGGGGAEPMPGAHLFSSLEEFEAYCRQAARGHA
ncbi:MAG: MerR family transcriptional regulator [Candidatus Eisenbacteria bacterium]